MNIIIAIIEIPRRIKSINANNGFLKKKKEKLQETFKIKLIPNKIAIFIFCFLFDFVHTKNSERAMRKNKIFQTTGKTQLGGVIVGFIEEYHSVLTFAEVKILPINAKE
jgi:hypothetical protein